ncbi:MAG TPA: hypothetical protein VF467_00150 [Afipia sp.]
MNAPSSCPAGSGSSSSGLSSPSSASAFSSATFTVREPGVIERLQAMVGPEEN